MILPVSHLEEDGAVFEGEDPVEVFEWVDSDKEVVHPAGPLKWKLHAQRFGSEIVVRGRAEALFEGVCCRCGGSLSRTWGDDVLLSLEVSPETAEVDLTSDLRETILLALPNNPVCSDSCAGLCPMCGKRLEDGACDCKPFVPDNPWSALGGLAFPDSSK